MTRHTTWAVLVLVLAATTPATARTSVLVLHTYGQDQPVRHALDEGIEKVLRPSGPDGVITYFETIEIHRFPDPEYEDIMSSYLQQKYATVHVSVIVVAFDTALRFLLRHRPALFPDIPIVTLLTSPQSLDTNLDITAIWNSLPVGKTVAAALALRPEIRHFVLIDGALGSGTDVQSELVDQLKTFGNRITFDYLKDRPLNEVVDRVRTLPSDAAVLFLRQLIDDDRQLSTPRQGLEAVLKASPVPVFGISDQLVGTGMVGGVMFDSSGDGEQLGTTAMRIANGVRARDIPAVEGPQIPLFDWRQVERWKLRAEALPAGSRVLFREPGFWAQYGRYVIGAVTIFILQSLLIGGLLLQRASRQRAEHSLRKSDDALRASAEHVRDLAGRLIAAQEDERRRIATELHDDVSQALAMLSIELEQLSQGSPTSRPRSGGTTRAVARIADITSSVSALSRRLHPPKLEVMGLTDAVSGLCRDVSRTHNIHVEFQNSALPSTIAPDVALCVYRITQEALHNVTKHSGAKRASVQLSAADNNLVLKIADSGNGFDVGRLSTKGLGLENIRDRVSFLKGRLEIQSAPGAGTQLMTQIPIRA